MVAASPGGDLGVTDRGGDAPSAVDRRAVGVFGTVLFLASDLMLFAGFFSAYFVLRARADQWPPPAVDLDPRSAALGTVVLVSSSIAFDRARHSLRRGDPTTAVRWLAITMALGVVFALNQLRDYASLDFEPSSHAYGGIYWTLTGLHGLHVLAGITALAILSWRVAVRPDRAALAFEATGLYWHLVDAVWVALFVTVWVIR